MHRIFDLHNVHRFLAVAFGDAYFLSQSALASNREDLKQGTWENRFGLFFIQHLVSPLRHSALFSLETSC